MPPQNSTKLIGIIFFDFQCKTNTIVIGLGGVFDFVLNPGETYYTKHANLRDFMIKNSTAGNNGVVTIIATVPNKFIKENLGGIL